MNKIYKVVRNRKSNQYVAVAEIAKGHGKSSRSNTASGTAMSSEIFASALLNAHKVLGMYCKRFALGIFGFDPLL